METRTRAGGETATGTGTGKKNNSISSKDRTGRKNGSIMTRTGTEAAIATTGTKKRHQLIVSRKHARHLNVFIFKPNRTLESYVGPAGLFFSESRTKLMLD